MMKGRVKNGIDGVSIKNAYEAIIANMRNKSAGFQKMKTLLITSCNVGEGKSTIGKGLGIYCARNDIKAIVVECDLRKRYQLENVLRKRPGLVECIEDGTPLEDAIVKDEEVHILRRGRETNHQIKLLMSKEFDGLVKELKSAYDLVIFDGPSLQQGSDGCVISTKVDGTMLVVAKGMTTFKQLEDAEVMLGSFDTKIWGVILNENSSRSSSGDRKKRSARTKEL